MATRNPITVRLPDHMAAEVDALLPLVRRAPELSTLPNVTRSDLVRLALLRGLEQLRREYGGQQTLPLE